ncbi:alkaline phosphatase D family protein [Variovorax sp. OV700]|uniref:alkaline phosphatase D family protein n=1 Tax=Variovorax sp. OV700 TaxID=1882826 RepID=UPI0008874AAF|nr:alkaline phosphatase D family protein [Variovorax sp. OV700]SDH73333.1 Choline dehydrogenase [Variovorax sp. OV700]
MNDGDRLLSEGAEVLVREILAAPPDALHCDVLVIGSGYGGAVAAARLAGAFSLDTAPGIAPGAVPIKVYLLERGSEYLPGEFPATFAELPGHVRFSMQDGRPARGNASGLFDLRLGGDVNALLGNGLGGGSLINAAVMERATPDAFEGGAWPTDLDLGALAEGYDKAEAMLALEQIPESVSKLDSLLKAGTRMHAASGGKAHVAIAFADGTRTPAQVAMHRCLRCGDCVSGCNHRAKKSLDTNYLALAHARGARLFTGGTAYRIAALPGAAGYAVEFFFTDRRKARTDNARPYVVRARRVVVAAGTLGSTELLKRSEGPGLCLSRALGEGFSTNGDMIAVAAGQHREALSCAPEGDAPATRGIGPTITGLLRTRAKKGKRPLVIEEFAIPAPLRRLLAEVVTTTDALQALAHTDLDLHAPDEVRDPLAVDDDMLRRTPVYGMMGDDGAAGSIELVGCGGSDKVLADAQVRVTWDKVAALPVFAAQMRALHAAHDGEGGLGGRVLPNPLWSPLPPFQSLAALHPAGSVLTVHPLGGCRMADGPERGVVDSWGRVYNCAAGEPPLLPGLAVLDGSIVPVSLGINPSLTIAALAERAVPVLAADWGLALTGSPQPPASVRPLRRDLTRPRAPAPTRVSLRERMTGRVQVDGQAFALSAEVEFEPIDVPALRRAPRALAQPVVVLRFGKGCHASVAHCSGTASMLVREKSDSIERILRSHALARKKLLSLAEALAEALLSARASTVDLSGDDGEKTLNFEGPPMADLMALCSHLGQVRLIEYDWTVERVEHCPPLKVGDRLRLTKRIAFVEGGNPWRQLSEGELQQIGVEATKPLGRLVLDPSYFVEQLQPLLRVEHQQDMPNQLGDLAELALWVLRIVLQVHLLHFVPPPDSPQNDLERLPGEVLGVWPERIDLVSAAGPGSAPPRLLSRYRPPKPRAGTRPVMLIHGYGASGSTFAHKSIPGNLVHSLLAAGREVWVLDLRTSIGFAGRPRGYWSFDEVAEADIPDALHTVQAAYATPDDAAPVQVDVVAHCIGAAMFSVAVLRSPSLHASIGAVVLSQVGPLLRATAFNRFRGYVAGYLQQFIGTDEFDTRPALTPMKRLLVDGLLATFPYPDDDGEAERLRKAPGFAAVRHRADAIFGQTMRLHNIGKDTLGALDSIYGFVKLRGLAQVGSYAREEVLTDAGGQGHAVGFEQLGERFGFPVFMLHGQRNAVFDWRGSYESFWLLKRVFGKDGGLSREPPELRDPSDPVGSDLFLGEGTPHQLLVLRAYGHQDTLIGENACTDVFPHIVRFLEAFDKKPGPGEPESPDWVARLPWTGPWLGHAGRVAGNAGRLHCRLALRPPPAHVSASAVVFVPARRRDGRWSFDFEWMVALPTTREKLLQEAVEIDLFDERLAEYQGFAVLTAHDDLPMARGPIDVRGRRLAPGLFAEPQDEPIEPIRKQVMRTLDAATDAQRERAVVRLDPAWIGAVQREGEPAQDSLCFALASCQYVPGLVDRLPAQASYRRLAQRLELLVPPHKPQLLVLAGDQVYVDQTAGLFVPAGGDDVGQAYALTFRLEALRQVMASLPTYPLLDDHEVMDDWEPGPDPYGTPAVRAALDGYFAQQHKLVRGIGPHRDRRPFDYRIAPAGFPFYMLDTRSTRQRRALRTDTHATRLDLAAIRAEAGMGDLKKWLEAAPAELPKFIVSPVALFPMSRAAAFGDPAERLGMDDWSGYPASQRALLELLRDTTARHVVLLSGDRHMSSVSSLWLQSADGPVEVISVVSSGLYAPWTFVNARPDAFWLDGEVELGAVSGAFVATMVTAAVGTGNGFAVLQVERGGATGHWRINVTLDLDDGLTSCSRDLDPTAGSGWTVHGPARFARA